MDEVIQKVAALGLPGVVLVVVMATTGLTGAAAITSALAILGGPAGMLGGIAVLGITGLIAETLAKIGLEKFLTSIYCQRRLTEPIEQLLQELNYLNLLNADIRERLSKTILDGSGCPVAAVDAGERSSQSFEGGSASVRTAKPFVSVHVREVIEILDAVPGMTQAHPHDFKNARAVFRLWDGTVLKTWKNLAGVDHVFLADRNDRMIYGGYVGWIHSAALQRAIERIRQKFQ